MNGGLRESDSCAHTNKENHTATTLTNHDGVSRRRTYLLSIDEARRSLVVCFGLVCLGAMSTVKRKGENLNQQLLSKKINFSSTLVYLLFAVRWIAIATVERSTNEYAEGINK